MATAFVLSGGGSLGAVQVGMLQALAAGSIYPDLLIGTSVGALNAAYVAGHGSDTESLVDLEATWMGLRTRDVFPLVPIRLLTASLGRAESICPNTALRHLIERHLSFERLEDAPIPLHVVAAEAASGKEVLLSSGSAVDAALPSSAIPAIFPIVQFEGMDLVDGGIADNAAISQAISLGADIIYVLPTGYSCALKKPPGSPLSSAVHALTLLIEQRLINDVGHYSNVADIRVMPPLCPLSVASTDFSQSESLISRARRAATKWLDGPDHRRANPEKVLALHSHDKRRRGRAG